MFDGAEVLAYGERDVLGGDIVLQVDPCPSFAERHPRVGCATPVEGRCDAGRDIGRRAAARLHALRERVGERPGAVGGADHGRTLDGCTRQQHTALGVPTRATAGMAIEMDQRRPTAGDREQVCGQRAAGSGAHALHTVPAERALDALAGEHLDAGRARRRHRRRVRARVDDGAAGADRRVGQRRLIGGIVAGGEHHLAARHHRVATQVLERCVGQHDAGTVVVTEQQRPLDRAGREHERAGTHLPDAAAVTAAFMQHRGVVVVETDRRRLRQHAGTARRQRCAEVLRPARTRHTVDDGVAPQQGAADARALLDEQHAATGLQPGARGGESGCAAADDAEVDIDVAQGAALRAAVRRDAAEAGHAADRPLIDMPVRPHEGLVVEGGRDEAREAVHHGEQVAPRAAKRVDRGERRAVDQGLERRTGVGLVARTRAQVEDGVGFLVVRAEQAARSVVLEAARDHRLAGGEQRGGERVAREAGVGTAVEAESERSAAVDLAAFGQAAQAAHARSVHGRSVHAGRAHVPARSAFMGMTAATSWVSVSRATTSQRPHPARCTHSSRAAPRVLVRMSR